MVRRKVAVFKTNDNAFQNTANYINDWAIRSCKLIRIRRLFLNDVITFFSLNPCSSLSKHTKIPKPDRLGYALWELYMDVTGSESWFTAGFLICSVVYFSNVTAGGIPSVKTRNPWNVLNFLLDVSSCSTCVHCCVVSLTLNPLTWKIWWAPNNASRWQTGFNSAFKGLTGKSRSVINKKGIVRKM